MVEETVLSARTAWIYLLCSGVIDVAWAISMKRAQGFASLGWSAVSVVLLAAFVYLLTRALSVLPLAVAYAAWTGIGAVGSMMAGALLFGEPVTALRGMCLVFIVAGVIGLRVVQ